MFEKLKAALNRLSGAGPAAAPEEPAAAVEYKGYRIRAEPYRTSGKYQTAGVIEKDTPDGRKEHRFIRAETHELKEDAVAFSITKAKQIIDQMGERAFT
jgi:hypothetical protein